VVILDNRFFINFLTLTILNVTEIREYHSPEYKFIYSIYLTCLNVQFLWFAVCLCDCDRRHILFEHLVNPVGSTGSTAVDTGRTYLSLVGAYIITG